MDLINNAIGEYQQMIGIHDKQPWERSVERAVSQSLHNLTRKRAKVNKDLIDVDLVRVSHGVNTVTHLILAGSTFSKIKPRHSWLTVSWKAFIRILFLPLYYKWWTSCCGRTGYAVLVLLFLSQGSSIYVYLTDDLTPVDEALSLSHLLTPSIMILILAIVHTQIMSSTSDQHSSSSCPSNQINRDKQSSENLMKNHDLVQVGYSERHRPPDCKCYVGATIASEEDDEDVMLDLAGSTCECDSSVSHPDVDLMEEKRMTKRSMKRDLDTTSNDTSCCRRRRNELKASHDIVIDKSSSPSRRSKECLCVNKNAASRLVHHKKHHHEDDEEDDDSCDIVSLLLKSPNSSGRTSEMMSRRLNKDDGHDTNSTTSSLNSDEDDDDDEEDDDVAVEDIVVMHENQAVSDTSSDKISDVVPKHGRHYNREEGRLPSRKSNCSRCSVDNKLLTEGEGGRDYDPVGGHRANLQNNNSDPSDGCVVRRRNICLHEVEGRADKLLNHGNLHLPRRKDVTTKENSKGESVKLFEDGEENVNEVVVAMLDGKALLNQEVNKVVDPVEVTRDDETSQQTDLLGPSIELERKISEQTHRSSPCQQQSNELVRSYNSKKSISTASNKVSCIIWDGGELQKVDLTILDIGWNIIKKVEKSCLSYDYLLLGVTFSVLLALTPIIFRAYHNWSILEGIKINGTAFSVAMSVAVGYNWRQVMVICNGVVQRLCLSCLLFFMLSVSERTFYQRLLYAKNFCYLTSLRRARKYQLPHFRLNKVRNIKTWLSIRSFLKRRGPQRSVEIIVSTAFLAAVVIVSIICIELLQDYGSFLDELGNWELVVWGLSMGVFLLRFITLGTNINKKYRNFSVLITEQINLYLHMELKPHKKNELMMANSVLKLAEDLLKEVESPFKVSGLSANPLLYNITKVVVLSAFSAVLTELLGFKLKLHKIKIRS